MKSIAKVLLVGTVAVMAIAVSAAPSEAKKRTKPKAGTYVGQICSAGCGKNNMCKVNMWTPTKNGSRRRFRLASSPPARRPARPFSRPQNSVEQSILPPSRQDGCVLPMYPGV
jgi:hypothetical protein